MAAPVDNCVPMKHSTITPVIFDGRAGHFRWPRRSFSMAAPVAAMAAPVAAIATHLCPYEAQYYEAQ